MKNPKKTGVERMASVELKKTAVSVIKCFICNQMFYSQKTFDDHMKLHSSKLARNVPEEIQRKTMESFRVKKNQTNTSTKDITAGGGKSKLNQTTGVIRPKLEEDNEDEKDDEISRKEIIEAKEALRESTILIEKIEALMHQQPEQVSQATEQAEKQSPTLPTKSLTQSQFLQLVLTDSKLGCQQAESTKFTNEYLQSCQDQLLYLSKMLTYLQKDQMNHKKYQTMRQNILEAMVQFIKDNSIVTKKEEESSSGLYLTGLQGDKTKETVEEQENGVEVVENQGVAYCNQCYMEIEYGQDCYRERTLSQPTNLNPRSYHMECWQQRNGPSGTLN